MKTTLEHLARLVEFDTTNPPRDIDPEGIFGYLRHSLPGFRFETWDHGDGRISLQATRGEPDLLFNCHIDTVPVAEGWGRDPWNLQVENDRAIGLGACDIKGAAACMLTAAARTTRPVALLFTSDEEAGRSTCVREWISLGRSFRRVFVAEPTQSQPVAAHRGIATCTGTFSGTPGHASNPRALHDSAVHEAVRWASLALAEALAAEAESFGSLQGIRFNLGRIEGGLKPNMIAGETTVRFGVRPLPDQRPQDVLQRLWSLAPHPDRVLWEPGFIAPPLTSDAEGDAVDFWTEAALFGEAGYTAVVLGPGDIAQAHTPGEWVAVDQLTRVTQTYADLIGG